MTPRRALMFLNLLSSEFGKILVKYQVLSTFLRTVICIYPNDMSEILVVFALKYH